MLNTRAYKQWLKQLKAQIQQQQVKIGLQVNAGMLATYWYIGSQLNEKIEKAGWGARVIDFLSEDLQKAFPNKQGFSIRNLKYMRQFAVAYPNFLIGQQAVAQLENQKKQIQQGKPKTNKVNKSNQFGQQAVAQIAQVVEIADNAILASIPWGHHVLLLNKIYEQNERIWYMQKTIENNWSRSVLQYQIDTNLYKRQVNKKKSSNFHLTLPKAQGELANQLLKDPFQFGFLQIGEKFSELELERELVKHIQEFLLELGAGFAFVGRQVKLKIGKKEHYTDLLFYHLVLRCYVIIDLKMDEFELSHAGQMNGYLNVINKNWKHPTDNPSIGIILCRDKDEIEVDFALQNIQQPIGVSEYEFTKALPRGLKGQLPTAKQLQSEVQKFLKQQSKNKRGNTSK